jgi:adenylate cyclase
MTMALPRRRTMLLESIGDPSLTAQAGFTVMGVKGQTGELLDVLRWSEATIERADGDPTKGALLVGSPLAAALGYRKTARWWFGRRGWREDLDDAFAIARSADAMTLAFVYSWNTVGILNGVLRADDAVAENLEAALRIGEASGDDYPVAMVKIALGSVLLFRDTAAERDRGLELLALGHDMCTHYGFPYRNSR